MAGFVLMGAKMFDTFQEGMDPESHLDLTVELPGEGRVQLEPGRYEVVALGPTLTAVSGMHSDAGGQDVDRLPFRDPDVTVTGPDGEPVTLEPVGVEHLSHTPGLDVVSFREFTVTTEGDYTLVVTGEPGPVTKVGVGEAVDLWDEAKGWVLSAVVSSVGGLLMTFGILALLGGVVWWVVGRIPTEPAKVSG